MQKFYTPNDCQRNLLKSLMALAKCESAFTPPPQLVSNLMAYASAMQVVNTKLLGNIYLLMN